MRACTPFNSGPKVASRRVLPVVAGITRRSTDSMSASTSSTTSPPPHSENDTATVVSAIPKAGRIASGRNPNGAPAAQKSSTSAGSTCSEPESAQRSDDRSKSPGLACRRNRFANNANNGVFTDTISGTGYLDDTDITLTVGNQITTTGLNQVRQIMSRREAILKVSPGNYYTLPAFSPDSRLVALCQPDHSVRIHELPSGAVWKVL